MNRPFYVKLYKDMITDKYPDKLILCENYLKKEKLTAIDVINLNAILFGSKDKGGLEIDQKHRAYDTESILYILKEQETHKMTNTEIANKYKISRNTIAKWKSLFNSKTIDL